MNNLSKILIGYNEKIDLITNNFLSKKLPNSIIIFGNEGIGKSTFSFHLIKNIYSNLIDNKHAKDHHINLIYNNTHSNVKYIERAFDEKSNKISNYINITQIRNLENFLFQTSNANLPKFIIIDSADNLNKNSSNALLKILEEPKENTYFILISHQLSNLLSTIRSRCVKFHFHNPSLENFKSIIYLNNKNIDNEKINFLYDICDSSPGIASIFLEEDILSLFNSIIDILNQDKALSNEIYELSNQVSSYNNDQFRIFISLIKFILINVSKINLGYNFNKKFKSNIIQSLDKLPLNLDNSILFNILEYLNNNENDLFTYNLDKKIFCLNIFSSLKKV